jgi:hypothetical protein
MHKVGIIGHSPEHLHHIDDVRSSIRKTIDLLNFQYAEQLMYNIIGDIGIGLIAAEECIESESIYHIFLPYTLEKTTQHWYKDQKDKMLMCYGKARGITICQVSSDETNNMHERLVEESSFIICFWVGKKQGKTFETIKYALQNNKLVLNGFDDLKLITNIDLKRKIY